VSHSIEIQNLGKTFGSGLIVFKDFQLTIYENEILSILGPSGCGKSTLLHLIAGLQKASSGRVEISPTLQSFGFVFQDPHLLPWRNLEQNVSIALEFQQISEAERRSRVAEALEMLGLNEFSKAYPAELSGGMKMRASLARALVTRPKVLLLDEPFAALDEPLRQKLDLELRRLWKSLGLTIIVVTHSITEAIFLSNRMIVLSDRPSRILRDEKIELPLERTSQMRWSPEVMNLATEVTKLIGDFDLKEGHTA
jgi:NitT/TauT family transport system ATP-binding protein